MSPRILLVACAAAFAPTALWAQSDKDGKTFTGKLEPVVSGALRSVGLGKPLSVSLAAEKPDIVFAEPKYKGTPHYGVLRLGSATNNAIAIVLDATDQGERTLYVDANGDGSLLNDPPIHLYKRQVSLEGSETAQDMLEAVVRPIARYDAGPGAAKKVPSSVLLRYFPDRGDSILVYRDFLREGNVRIGLRSYHIGLVTETGEGNFSVTQTPNATSLLIDLNNDGEFNRQSEKFDAATPFQIGRKVYEVASADSMGSAITLKFSDKKPAVKVEDTTPAEAVPGGVIPFVRPAVSGKSVNFPKDYKGKIVLLDFWATWCGPCLAELPNVKAVYAKYHPQGFEILSVSLDSSLGKLKSFLQENPDMPWQQIADGKGWNAEVAKMYGVNSIPHMILVDGSTGKILAQGGELRGEGLGEAVGKAVAGKGK